MDNTTPDRIIAKLDDIAQSLSKFGFKPEEGKIPIYQYSTAVWIYILGNLLTIFLVLQNNLLGLIGSVLLWIILVKEIFLPTVAKIASKKAHRLLVTIPARSKETQKLIILTSYSGEASFKTPLKMKPQVYLIAILSLGMLNMACMAVNYFSGKPQWIVWLTILPLFLMTILNFLSQKNNQNKTDFQTSNILLETIAVLTKIRALTTTVTFCFTDTRSHYSGIVNLAPVIKSGPELTYTVNLTNLSTPEDSGDTIGIIKSEGSIISKNGDPVLRELLKEVANAKTLQVKEKVTQDFTETHSLLLQKKNAITLAIEPNQTEETKTKDIRELLLGLIRRLDH